MHQHRLIIPLLILITLAAFWRAASCQFVDYDDGSYVANPYVRGGLTPGDIAWAFTNSHLGYPHPLTWLSLMLDSDLQGTGPRGYHVTNILLHTLAVALLYLALQSLTAAPWRSALVALLFAIHPLRVESVAWVSERKDVLSGCLAFAALFAYAAYTHRPNWRRYLLVALLFVLGLLAKPILVTLPCLLLLLDAWPLRRIAALSLPPPSPHVQLSPPRSPGWLVLEKIPLLILAAADSVIAYVLQNKVGAVPGGDKLDLPDRLANVPISYVRYLGKMVWFRGLIVVYPFHAWPLWQSFAAALLLLLVTVAVLIRFRLYPWLAIGWFWFLGMLVPVIGFVPVAFLVMADRFTYLPAVGLLVMLIWSLPDRLWQSMPGRTACMAVTVTVVVFLGASTWRQIGYWHDSVTLFRHVIAFAPDNAVSLVNLGVALDYQEKRPQESLFYLRKAAQVAPDFPLAQTRLGTLLERMGQNQKNMALLEEAIPHLRRAVELQPHDAQAHNALGLAYLRIGQVDQAQKEFQQAVLADPQFVPAYVLSGDVMASTNRIDGAIREYQRALFLHPDDASLYFHIGNMLATHGSVQAAIPYMQRAIQLDPGNLGFRAMLSQAHAAMQHSNGPSPTAASQP